MRVSTAVVIKKTKNRESFTKRILDESASDSKGGFGELGFGSSSSGNKQKKSPYGLNTSNRIKDEIIEELSFDDLE